MPETGNSMIAAYLVVAVIVAGYAWSLWRRSR